MSQYAKKIEPLLGTKWCLDCNLKLFLDCEMECFPSWKILITFQWKARSRDRGGQWSGTPWLLRACVAECSPEDLWSVYRKGATSSSSKMDDRCAPALWVWNIIFFLFFCRLAEATVWNGKFLRGFTASFSFSNFRERLGSNSKHLCALNKCTAQP